MQHVRDGIILHYMILIRSKIEAAIILKIRRNFFLSRRLYFAIRVIAESGLLYTITSIAVFFALLLGTNGTNTAIYSITRAIVCYYQHV